MTRIPMYLGDFKIKKFEKFLAQNGAQMLRLTNEWELIRCQVDDQVLILYKNKSGRLAWPEGLITAYQAYANGGRWTGHSNSVSRRKRTPVKVMTIVERDGPGCWYCGEFKDIDPQNLTIEHMLDKSKGGGNHIHNLVMACKPCNQAVQNKSVAEKVRFREKKRGMT